MTRLQIWFVMLGGGCIYYSAKVLAALIVGTDLKLSYALENMFEAAYWSAGTLLVQWVIAKVNTR